MCRLAGVLVLKRLRPVGWVSWVSVPAALSVLIVFGGGGCWGGARFVFVAGPILWAWVGWEALSDDIVMGRPGAKSFGAFRFGRRSAPDCVWQGGWVVVF